MIQKFVRPITHILIGSAMLLALAAVLGCASTPDVQAGFEKGLTTAVVALAGAQYNHHAAGMLDSMLTVAYEQFVIDDDICSCDVTVCDSLAVSRRQRGAHVLDRRRRRVAVRSAGPPLEPRIGSGAVRIG